MFRYLGTLTLFPLRHFLGVICVGLAFMPFGALADEDGGIVYMDVPSASLGHDVKTAIYRPNAKPPAGGWPVLYLLHGLGGDATSWQRLGNIEATLDRMIAAGDIAPLLVVMPDADNSWYVNAGGIGSGGAYETALMRDFPDWIEAHYPTRVDRGGRAVAGLSMGGYGALRFAMKAPERYVVVAALSPAIWQNVPDADLDSPPETLQLMSDTAFFQRTDRATVTDGVDMPPPGKHFAGAFGEPFNARFFNAQNVFTLLADRIDNNGGLPVIYVTVGDDDSHKLWRGAIELYETLQADQRDSELRITDGDHDWALWKVSIIDALIFINTQFTPTADDTPPSVMPSKG